MEKYWELKVQLPNKENQKIINEFFLSMKVANKSKNSIDTHRYFLQTFFKEIEDPFWSLKSEYILDWLIQHDKGFKDNTKKNHLSALSCLYRYCIKEGYIEKSPIKLRWFPRLGKPIPKYFDKEEVAKIRQQAEKSVLRDRVLVEFLLTSGCRIGEVHMLNREQVDLENRTARVLGKGKKIRQVHFSEKCSLLLESYLETRIDDDPALFVTINGRMNLRWMQQVLNKIGIDAGLTESLHPHRLRHTFATDLLSKGADLSFIGDELGHRDLKTTLIYATIPKKEIVSMYHKYMG